jgi:hypothetical protein
LLQKWPTNFGKREITMSRAQIKEMSGQKFGRLKVIKFAHQDKHGEETIVLGISLRSGNTQSCGCKNIEIISSRKGTLNPAFKHGHSHKEGQPGSPTYVSWRAMKKRCLDPNAEKWPKYGGANPPIKICERWLGEEGFTNFLTDLGERPKGTTLGRFHDVGDYEPSNVAWMTPMQQRQNWRPDRNPGACQKKAA